MSKSILTIPILWFLMACQSAPVATIDHVIVAVPDLERAMASFASDTGVTPIRGGHHPGLGTENALVSLGDGVYLELIAAQRDTTVESPMLEELRALDRPRAAGWALRVGDAQTARALLRERGLSTTEPQAGSRKTPAGDVLEWVAFGVESESDRIPFFIQWGATTRHPSTTSPAGCALEAFEVHDPAASTISRVTSTVGVKVPIRAAERPNMIIRLACGDRRVSFTHE